ncbi:MAG: hypothetical protein AAGH92_13605 [Planctomycetota bacterium]
MFDQGVTEFREMMSNRRLRTISSGLTGVVLLMFSFTAAGQDRLDAGVLGNPDFWSPEQRQDIEGFVDRQIAAIADGDETQINQGRANLTDPTRTPGVSDRFMSQFSELVGGKLEALMAADDLRVRVNTMVVAMGLPHPAALEAIRRGLVDESAGVRYPAARAIEGLLSSGQLSAAQTVEILEEIQQLIANEDDVYVVQPLLDAMLATPDNTGAVLEVLNQRIGRHVDQPEASFAPEASALQSVLSRLGTAQEPSPGEVDDLARVSARHLMLAARQLADAEVPENGIASHVEIIRAASVALEFAYQNRGSRELQPRGVGRPITDQNWPAVIRIAENWVQVLKAEPFNFTDADLNVEPAAPQAAAE